MVVYQSELTVEYSTTIFDEVIGQLISDHRPHSQLTISHS